MTTKAAPSGGAPKAPPIHFYEEFETYAVAVFTHNSFAQRRKIEALDGRDARLCRDSGRLVIMVRRGARGDLRDVRGGSAGGRRRGSSDRSRRLRARHQNRP